MRSLRTTIIAAVAAILPALPAHAGSHGSAAACRALLAPMLALPDVTAEVSAPQADTCLVEGFGIRLSRYQIVKADSVRLTSPDLASGLAAGALPRRLSMEARGLALVTSPNDKVLEFIYSSIRVGYTLTFDYSFDAASRTLTVSDLMLVGGVRGGGNIGLKGALVLPGDDLRWDALAGMSFSTAIRDVELHVENHGLVQGFVAMPLLVALLSNAPDPAARLAEVKGIAGARVEQELGGGSAAVAALKAWIAAFPQPDGRLDIRFAPKEPVTAASLGLRAMTPGSLAPMLGDGAVTASFVPAP